MSFFQGVLYGRLGVNPEPRQTQGGQEMSIMSIGWTDTFSGNKATQWCMVKAFGKTAVFCNQYLQKGDAVIVCGTMNVSDYVGKDGIKRKNCELLASRIESCSRPAPVNIQQHQEGGQQPYQQQPLNNGQPPPFPQMPGGSGDQAQAEAPDEVPF